MASKIVVSTAVIMALLTLTCFLAEKEKEDQLPKSVVVAILLVDIAALLNCFCIITYALVMYPVNIFQRRRQIRLDKELAEKLDAKYRKPVWRPKKTKKRRKWYGW
ncbi:PREDICTED: uncharacterized protein LOC107348986 [Acropora digitifera]|uniref:uncharacterized protein LOC107348986 n=1 Tax=Acropora digitifera TaxID=70779 RepID=UPI00077ABA08|nr:PREDICTED: uncharacterized protein LOC107348986 [Acropora digitifera]XP_029207140.2 uncharacterized protein LOC114970824 [Acropora millepora]